MDLKEIRQILKLMEEHDLGSFQLETKDFKLRLRRGPDTPPYGSYAPVAAPTPMPAAGLSAATSAVEDPVETGSEITSPMVGTFYRSPSPEAEALVEVGTKVKAGEVVCIIEAMKVMNEIKTDISGTITELVVDDATPVQFGEALFRVKAD